MARKLVLKVSPDINSDGRPQVKLDNRQPHAGGAVKIEWEKDKKANTDFEFIGFLPVSDDGATNPFKDVSIKKDRIKCDFEPQEAGVEYKYTVAIEHQGVAYDTDLLGDTDPGKAVIRN